MTADRGYVYVYTACTDTLQDFTIYNVLYSAVSDERRRKTDRLRFFRDKRLSIGVEYLLMHACKELGIDYRKETIVTGSNGKPDFKNPDIHFNLSHSGNMAMCAVSDSPVGCDIERITEADINCARRFFSPAEVNSIIEAGSIEKMNRMFYRIWTLRESYVKCTGMGLRKSLDTFSVCFDGSSICIMPREENDRYSLYENCIQDLYCSSVCIERETDNMRNTCVRWHHTNIEIA